MYEKGFAWIIRPQHIETLPIWCIFFNQSSWASNIMRSKSWSLGDLILADRCWFSFRDFWKFSKVRISLHEGCSIHSFTWKQTSDHINSHIKWFEHDCRLCTFFPTVTTTNDFSRAPRLHLAMHSQRWPSELVVVLDQLHNCEGKKFNCVGGFWIRL